MRAFGAFRGHAFFGRNLLSRSQRRNQRSKAGSGQPLSGESPPRSWLTNPVLKAAYTSGSLCLAGDLLAQLSLKRGNQMDPSFVAWDRSARMGTFGLVFYGPYQHWWYNLLSQEFPLKSTPHFLTKGVVQVALNQLVLGPIVTTAVFTWNLLLQQKSSEIPGKLKHDLVPTMVNGWKFWVPASSINFWLIPVQSQVLYMSVCGLLWTAYLSYSSNTKPQLVTS